MKTSDSYGFVPKSFYLVDILTLSSRTCSLKGFLKIPSAQRIFFSHLIRGTSNRIASHIQKVWISAKAVEQVRLS